MVVPEGPPLLLLGLFSSPQLWPGRLISVVSYRLPPYHGAIGQNGSDYHGVDRLKHSSFQAPGFAHCSRTHQLWGWLGHVPSPHVTLLCVTLTLHVFTLTLL